MSSPIDPMTEPQGWQPIESARRTGRYIWLGAPGRMRIGFWADGKEHENHGSVGGGWIDLSFAEAGRGPRGLQFGPTCWQDLPDAPEPPQRGGVS